MTSSDAGGLGDDALISQARDAPFTGWDFSWLHGRSSTTPLPWDYAAEVTAAAAAATSMLDMGTGGGEFLATLPGRPARTVATEGWPPNVPVAAGRLHPVGVPVLHTPGAPDNMSAEAQAELAGTSPPAGRLPFRDGALDLVINRHESFSPREVGRVLRPGGRFITQQVDYRSDGEIYDLLGLPMPAEPDSWLPLAVGQLTAAGLDVTIAKAGETMLYLNDVGALVYYLKIVPWIVPQYDVGEFLPRLRAIATARDKWPAPVTGRRFLVVATRMPTVRSGK
ncbi:MAG TPA: class I SAM-dependent methyltransferase [Streptosporangiaceae bacterium]